MFSVGNVGSTVAARIRRSAVLLVQQSVWPEVQAHDVTGTSTGTLEGNSDPSEESSFTPELKTGQEWASNEWRRLDEYV